MMVSDVHLYNVMGMGVALIYNYKKKKERGQLPKGSHGVQGCCEWYLSSFVSFPHHEALVQVQTSLPASCR